MYLGEHERAPHYHVQCRVLSMYVRIVHCIQHIVCIQYNIQKYFVPHAYENIMIVCKYVYVCLPWTIGCGGRRRGGPLNLPMPDFDKASCHVSRSPIRHSKAHEVSPPPHTAGYLAHAHLTILCIHLVWVKEEIQDNLLVSIFHGCP